MTYVKSFLLTLGLTFMSSMALAQEVPIQNFSTDNKLLSEVKTRMVLDNGLVIHIWEWNEKAKGLGMDEFPPAGLIAQDVELMYPEAQDCKLEAQDCKLEAQVCNLKKCIWKM